jgi:hypothetical protein
MMQPGMENVINFNALAVVLVTTSENPRHRPGFRLLPAAKLVERRPF